VKLVLGVNPASYSDPAGISGKELHTVQEVAKAIESKYGLMGKFVDLNEERIGDAVAEMLVQKLEGKDVLNKDISKISQPFKEDLEAKIFDGFAAYVPTKASIQGKRWRKNSPVRGKGRPSFVDTGLYKDSMSAVLKDA